LEVVHLEVAHLVQLDCVCDDGTLLVKEIVKVVNAFVLVVSL
jgi:hypothetical protein